MHEFGLCESFMDAVLRRAAGRKVTGVRVRVGALHRVEFESFRQAFGLMALGSVAEGASVDLVTTPAVLGCADCGARNESAELLATCPGCGGTDLRLDGGDELVLESIRVAGDGVCV